MTAGDSIPSQLSPPTTKISDIYTASSLKDKNVTDMIASRQRRGMAIATPTLAMATATHNNVFAKSFRPHILVAEQYTTTIGSGQAGGTFVFDVRFNCDYHNDGYFKWRFPSVQCTPGDLPAIIGFSADPNVNALNGGLPVNFGAGRLATVQEAESQVLLHNTHVYDMSSGVPQDTTFTHDDGKNYTILTPASDPFGRGGISLRYVTGRGAHVAGPDGKLAPPDANGFGAGAAADPFVQSQNFVRAADLLGLKLHKLTQYTVDNNCIQEYTDSNARSIRKFFMQKYGNRLAFDRLIGQEVPEEQAVQSHTTVSGKSIGGLGERGAASCTTREYRKHASGLQTPKLVQPASTIIVPGLFQHMLAREYSTPVVTHPDADVIYNVQTRPLSELYCPAPGDIFIEETIYAVCADDPTAADVSSAAIQMTRKIPFVNPNSTLDFDCSCDGGLKGEFIINNLYLDDLLHLCLISRVYFEPLRSFRDITKTKVFDQDCSAEDNLELNGLKFPVEWLIIEESPIDNGAVTGCGSAVDPCEDWHRNGQVVRVPASDVTTCTFRQRNFAGDDYEHVTQITQNKYNHITKCQPCIKRLGVQLHDTEYQPLRDRSHYTDFTKWFFHNGIIHSDDDPCGMLFVRFSQRPLLIGQSFGSASVTRQRYIGFRYETNAALEYSLRDGIMGGTASSRSNKVRLTFQAMTLNFLLGSDGSLSQRYQ